MEDQPFCKFQSLVNRFALIFFGMCLIVNKYQTCALFGHAIQAVNTTGLEAVLCDEAEIKSNTFGMCSVTFAHNVL